MTFGSIVRQLPPHNSEKVRLLADRFLRNQTAHQEWAKPAKECVDFVEGRQWTKEQLKKLKDEGRPALVFNKIGRLVKLVMGFHRNNRTDTKFIPGTDGSGTDAIAEAISQLWKQYAENTDLEYVDTEVFMDGIITGRGYYDTRMKFDSNDFGDIRTIAEDPFSIYIDSDADDYNLDKANGFNKTKWASLDEIEANYGVIAKDAVSALVLADGFNEFPRNFIINEEEITPVRGFRNEDSDNLNFANSLQERFHDFVDPMRKNIRIVDSQYWQTSMQNMFVDLETGDRSIIPQDWPQEKIDKVFFHAEQIRNPLRIVRRPVKRVRWTVVVGDVIVWDDWSPYDHFTIDGYFPYFRRGQTRGMVQDLLDPQREINKRRSAEIDIVGRTTNSGWMHHEDSLDPLQEQNLDDFGSSPGIRIKWKGQAFMKPDRINPSPPPTSMERLEKAATADLQEISGINDSALGQLDRVQSGRAIEARQRQAIIAIQPMLDNFARTKKLQARKFLRLVQTQYTEERVVRILGEDGKLQQSSINQGIINMETGEVVAKLNDVTLGKYAVVIDEVPMSASFLNAQFEEAMELLEKLGPVIGPAAAVFADVIVDLSSMPRKEEIKERLQAALKMAQQSAQGDGQPQPGGGSQIIPGESLVQQGGSGGAVVPIR